MQYLREKLNYLASYFVRKVEENKDRKVTKCEIYLEHLYKIFSWEDSAYTLGIFILCNFVFWLIVLFEIRPLGIFFSTTLMLFLYDSFLETRDHSTYQLQHREAIDDINNCFQEVKVSLLLLKKESPSTFSLGAFMFFLFLSILANKISGYLLMYIVLLEIFFIPLLFKILPEECSSSIKNFLKSLCNARGVLAEDELIPFIANKDFSAHDMDLDSLLTDKTADSATNSLASGISIMPSYLDVENQDDIQEEDLIPSRGAQVTSLNQGELSSDSDSEHRDINFDSTHFNGDSSSEEEKLFGKGLAFSDLKDTVAPTANITESKFRGMLSNLAVVGSSLLTSAITSTVKQPIEKENSSSDSEFEIINKDDIKE